MIIHRAFMASAAILQTTLLFAADPQIITPQSYGALQIDRAIEGGKITIAGIPYENGYGSHATSEIPVPVPPNTKMFSGKVGVDDAAGEGKGSVIFRILAGERILWESPVMKSGDPAQMFEILISSNHHRLLYLQADEIDNHDYDHANWVDLKWHSGKTETADSPRVFKGSEFGLKPNTTDDQSAAFRTAITALRKAPGSTLKLAKGEYHFHAAGALKRHFHISNHEQVLWHPVSIPLVDLHDVTIDGQDSLLLFHGMPQPILIMDSENITLRNLALDYAIPHHSQGILTEVTPEHYTVEIDPVKYPHEIREGWFTFTGEGWETPDHGYGIIFDGETRAIVAGTSDYHYQGPLTKISEGKYQITKNLAKDGIKTGDAIVFRHNVWSNRPHPGIVLYRAKRTALHDVSIHSAHGMGLLAQRSKDIHIKGGGVFPREETGRFFSTNADATHFSNCKGLILAEDSRYEGMMDDAINVHATCLRIEELLEPNTLRCRYMHGQAVGFETFLPGEKLRFIEAKTLSNQEKRKITAVQRLNNRELLITLDQPVPPEISVGDAIENADWFPAVTFRNNTIRHNRARGSLFTTPREILVENNTFESIAGSAILLAGDANGWFESGACQNVAIRNNTFRNNLTSRFQFTEAIISIYPEVPDLAEQKNFYHSRVRIEDNLFETFDVPLLFAISTEQLIFKNNRVNYNDTFPAWDKKPFIFRRCDKVLISQNHITHDGRPVSWTIADIDRDNLTPQRAIKIK